MLRLLVTSALPSAVVACAPADDREPAVDDGGGRRGAGHLYLQFSGVGWGVEGQFARDWRLEVLADGRSAFEGRVAAGAFRLSGTTPFPVECFVEVRAYEVDGSNRRVEVCSDPGPDGMYGQSRLTLVRECD